MALDLVANLVRQATVDSGVAHALRYNPQVLRTQLGLSPAHVTALKSAEAFPFPAMSLKSASTTVLDTAVVTPAGPANGNLLPPEGVGPEPPGDVQLPGRLLVPHKTPHHVSGPKVTHPAPRTPGPAVPGIRSTGHGHPPSKHTGSGPLVRQPSAPAQVTGPAPTTQRQPGPAQAQPSSAAQETQAAETAGAAELQAIVAAATHGADGCDCGCCVSTVAIVASVASTAQTAITAITAIAKMGNDS